MRFVFVKQARELHGLTFRAALMKTADELQDITHFRIRVEDFPCGREMLKILSFVLTFNLLPKRRADANFNSFG